MPIICFILRAYEGYQDASVLPEPRASREKLAVLENQESQDQMDHVDQRVNKEHQGTMVPQGFLGRKEKRGPREFLAWRASKGKWDGLGRLESLDQRDLKGHRVNQDHRVQEGKGGDLSSASGDPRAWTGKKEKWARIAIPLAMFCMVWFPEILWRPDPLRASTSTFVATYKGQRNLT
ncbi:hypothetical protein Q9233_013294 [Columba guinea]|nr:hypothetical protein Q9233_013294 [Columba guinea]